MRKLNTVMAMQWVIYLPILLPMCLVFGAIQGVCKTLILLIHRICLDIELYQDVESEYPPVPEPLTR